MTALRGLAAGAPPLEAPEMALELVRMVDSLVKETRSLASNLQTLHDSARHQVPNGIERTESLRDDGRRVAMRVAQLAFRVGLLQQRLNDRQRRAGDLPHAQTVTIGRQVDDPPIELRFRPLRDYAPACGVETEGGAL